MKRERMQIIEIEVKKGIKIETERQEGYKKNG